uniref:Uncharacterized protein n=1 Tax=Arion vulgaris TaxID=1028688 RepID=A0A0B6ZVZ4_9EUPU
MQTSWPFTGQVRGDFVKDNSGGFAVTMSSLTMETMAVTYIIDCWTSNNRYIMEC